MKTTAIGAATLTLALLLVAASAWPWQATHPVSGRKIAPVMSAEGAAWLERPEREREEEPDLALDAIGLARGMTAADVGAGVGYFAIRMARRVGPEGKVYATDIQPKMLELLKSRLRREALSNVVPVLGTETDPKLPPAAVDLVLLVDVYHEFSRPRQMLDGIRRSLKPDGRLVLLEYRKEDPSLPIRPEHKMSVAEARQELEAEGFRLAEQIGILPRQHILVFRKLVQ